MNEAAVKFETYKSSNPTVNRIHGVLKTAKSRQKTERGGKRERESVCAVLERQGAKEREL